jgi:hypothetical protein
MDLWSSELYIWESMGYQVSQSVWFWTKAGTRSWLWWQDLMDQFIEDEGKLGHGFTSADKLENTMWKPQIGHAAFVMGP